MLLTCAVTAEDREQSLTLKIRFRSMTFTMLVFRRPY